MVLHNVLRSLVILLLAASLVLFAFRLSREVRKKAGPGGDFGVGFSAFITAWIATELIAIFAPETWMEAEEILHFAVLVGLAAWINIRWRWSLHRAVGERRE